MSRLLRRKIPALFSLLFMIGLLWPVPAAGADTLYEVTYAGKIGAAAVRMQLQLKGGAVAGSTLYNRVRGPYRLQGSLDRLRRIHLQEYDRHGRLVGVFQGRLPSLLQFYGTWSGPEGLRRLGFNLTAAPPPPAPGQKPFRAGIWSRIGVAPYEPATLIIAASTPQGFRFTLTAFSGSHTGVVTGIAKLNGNVAIWTDPRRGCRLQLAMVQDLLSITAFGNCSDTAGAGVFFDGDYHEGVWNEPLPTLVDLGVLDTPAQDSSFRELVGRFYDLFVETFHLLSPAEDLDGLGAKVMVGWVRGLNGSDEAIVMAGPDGSFSAAVLDGERIRYFSDMPGFQERPPRTVAQWCGRFPEKKLVRMNERAF
ncbi:hypothetical protein EDC14_10565 [Hydrogenispora ethanolica]|uniref:Uncharacterized protein n=1 Tax=Hydrogenispora ethanolica TaxID=1082276 RepID=A0A4R1QR14_HYDET|nr:hypothetical protein [Hydrogenispora ethanolica]TCL55353.1 hypothetical protein EDC14_10565 [Hydrogenispora ethanolica]